MWSRASITWVAECLQECQNDHHQSCGWATPSTMPTRVIHFPRTDSNRARVVDTANGASHPYIALSYCWGGAERNKLQTTRGSLADRQRGFSISELPRTIRDAVTVARDIGVQYLWVDSLCIAQDDNYEKEREMGKMGQVYAGALLTISASKASRCDEGFLQDRDLKAEYGGEVYKFPWRGGNAQDCEGTGSFVFSSEREFHRLETEPVDKRAWTMQEHRLSQRLLRFGKGQLVWKCQESVEVDGGTADGPPPRIMMSERKDQLLCDWTDVVTEYTSRCISRAEDRLPAVAAIARQFSHWLGCESRDYLAGIWKQGLPLMLLWFIPEHDGPQTIAVSSNNADMDPSMGFPTWSWHLAPRGVQFGETFTMSLNDSRHLTVEEFGVEVKSPDAPFGMVKSGYLVVQGFLHRFLWTGVSFCCIEPGDLDGIVSIDAKWDVKGDMVSGTFYCLEVVKVGWASLGLILKGVAEDNFHRVGYFESAMNEGLGGDESAHWLRASRRKIRLQ